MSRSGWEEELTKALSAIILRIEYASLLWNQQFETWDTHVHTDKDRKRIQSKTKAHTYVKVTAKGSPSGTATTTMVT